MIKDETDALPYLCVVDIESSVGEGNAGLPDKMLTNVAVHFVQKHML